MNKLVIWGYKDDKFKTLAAPDPFVVTINPDEYSHSYEIVYNCATGQGAKAKSPQFNQVGREHVSFTLWFDGSGVVPDMARRDTTSIQSQITKFRQTVFDYNGDIHRPNFLKLSWGSFLFECSLEKLDITYTMFTPAGEPIRAKCTVSFISYTAPKALAAEKQNSSPDMSHLITVRAGDTLPHLCHHVYGSSAHYAKVARVNGLGSFRALRPGMQLLFPPLRQRGR
jgi:hypothetical protein